MEAVEVPKEAEDMAEVVAEAEEEEAIAAEAEVAEEVKSKRKHNSGGSGNVQDRHYSPREYADLSPEQKSKLQPLRAARKETAETRQTAQLERRSDVLAKNDSLLPEKRTISWAEVAQRGIK